MLESLEKTEILLHAEWIKPLKEKQLKLNEFKIFLFDKLFIICSTWNDKTKSVVEVTFFRADSLEEEVRRYRHKANKLPPPSDAPNPTDRKSPGRSHEGMRRSLDAAYRDEGLSRIL